MKHIYQVGERDGDRDGERCELEIVRDATTYLVRWEGREYRVEAQADPGGDLRLSIDGQPFRFLVSSNGNQRWITGRGETRCVQHVPADRPGVKGRASRAHLGSLSASMPGQVLKLLVGPGDTVTQGQVMVILEAMKMEHEIRSPEAGRVAAVNCAVGDMVSPNVPLLELAPLDAEEAP